MDQFKIQIWKLKILYNKCGSFDPKKIITSMLFYLG